MRCSRVRLGLASSGVGDAFCVAFGSAPDRSARAGATRVTRKEVGATGPLRVRWRCIRAHAAGGICVESHVEPHLAPALRVATARYFSHSRRKVAARPPAAGVGLPTSASGACAMSFTPNISLGDGLRLAKRVPVKLAVAKRMAKDNRPGALLTARAPARWSGAAT
jgi:hypothetical protein